MHKFLLFRIGFSLISSPEGAFCPVFCKHIHTLRLIFSIGHLLQMSFFSRRGETHITTGGIFSSVERNFVSFLIPSHCSDSIKEC